ncbi:hypothetical protein ACS0TY_006333 [Phlomoides rotata]
MSRGSGATRCYCQREAVFATSCKDGNVGQRFYGCQKYSINFLCFLSNSNDGYCKFFCWIDQPLCKRAKQIIPGLLKRLNEQREEIRNMEAIAEKLNEMTRVLESLNNKLEEEIQALKDENGKLICQNMKMKMKMEENRKFIFSFSCNLKLLVKVSALFCFFLVLVNVMCKLLGLSEDMEMKMLG